MLCFSDETLVRTVFEINTPIISAIGHETDDTLCDLVADCKASTPTMAASLAVNDKEKLTNLVNHLNVRLLDFMSSQINDYKKEFNYMLSKSLFRDSTYVYKSKRTNFDNLCNRFDYASSGLLNSNKVCLKKSNHHM